MMLRLTNLPPNVWSQPSCWHADPPPPPPTDPMDTLGGNICGGRCSRRDSGPSPCLSWFLSGDWLIDWLIDWVGEDVCCVRAKVFHESVMSVLWEGMLWAIWALLFFVVYLPLMEPSTVFQPHYVIVLNHFDVQTHIRTTRFLGGFEHTVKHSCSCTRGSRNAYIVTAFQYTSSFSFHLGKICIYLFMSDQSDRGIDRLWYLLITNNDFPLTYRTILRRTRDRDTTTSIITIMTLVRS